MGGDSKILITGTPGWLGSRLAECLLKEGKRVRCLTLPNVDAPSLVKTKVEIVKGDITDVHSLKGICKDVSTVFHCTGIIHPRKVNQFYEVNTQGTKNLVAEAISSGVEKFIYISSSCAGTGDSVSHLVDERDPPKPFMHYGLSKLKAEKALKEHYQNGEIKIIIIRPCWIYGIGSPPRQLKFLKMIKGGRPILFGNGKTLRSLCGIDNCIQALLLAEKSDKAVGQIYYIADSRPYNILDIYNTIADLLKVKIKPRLICHPTPKSFLYEALDRFMQGMRFYFSEIHLAWEWSKNVACSIKKAKEELGYYPQRDLREEMRLTIDSHRKKEEL